MSADPSLPQRRAVRHVTTASDLLAGVPGTLFAIATALGGLLTAVQSHQDGQATSKASYETLKVAVERNTELMATHASAQVELRGWVQELSERLERRQVNTEKALARKVTKPSSSRPVLPPVEPVPPAPAAPPAPPPSALPTFETLSER